MNLALIYKMHSFAKCLITITEKAMIKLCSIIKIDEKRINTAQKHWENIMQEIETWLVIQRII